MALLKAQVVFANQNGNPDDVYVNTFHFSGPTSAAQAIADTLATFYSFDPGGTPQSIGSYLSPALVRGETGLLAPRVKVYELASGPPHAGGDPILEDTFPLPAATSPAPLPHELAVCLSYYAGTNSPSKRGRIYIGPLGTHALGAEAGGDARPLADFRLALRTMGNYLMGQSAAIGAPWSVFGKSTVIGSVKVMRTVTGGWIDNAFDVQRRRGSVSTSREVWPTA